MVSPGVRGTLPAATIQLANVFVLVEAYAVRRFQLSQVWVTYLLLLLGILSSLLLASSWSTVVIAQGPAPTGRNAPDQS